MKRLFDLVFSLLLLVFLSPILILISVAIKLTSRGPVIYWSERIGQNNQIFLMPKFRSMHVNTPALATHLLKNPNSFLTPIGGFLRKSSLDELPQLWSVIRGHMSFVGPRPALFNQEDLIKMRSELGVDRLLPGITGWAQVNGRDDLPIVEKVVLDTEYLKRRSFIFDCYIIFLTVIKVMSRDGINH